MGLVMGDISEEGFVLIGANERLWYRLHAQSDGKTIRPLSDMDQYRVSFYHEHEHTEKSKHRNTSVIALICSTKVILHNLFAMHHDSH